MIRTSGCELLVGGRTEESNRPITRRRLRGEVKEKDQEEEEEEDRKEEEETE